jgi:hypothetical protein
MALPALLYVTFVPKGSDIRGLGIAAALAQAVSTQKGAIFGGAIAILGVWILFKAQLDILDGMTRAITDILWTGSTRIRSWRGGDVRVVYYAVLAVIAVWGYYCAATNAADHPPRAQCEHGRHSFHHQFVAFALRQHASASGRVAAANVATCGAGGVSAILRVLLNTVAVEFSG